MNDLQAFKVINSMPGRRRVMQFHDLVSDRYLMFYADGRRLDVFRSAVTGIVRITESGQREIGDPRWN